MPQTQENVITPRDIVEIVKRRKVSLIVPTLFVLVLAVIVALIMPSIYLSSSTILIEQQGIPTDFVMSAVTSYVEQRLQSINQRIMSSTRLIEVINRFDLYNDLKGKLVTEEIVDKMRKDVSLQPISAEVMDKLGRPSTATIAFSLSYEGKDPAKVQKVAMVLASLFLQENLQVRERQATETSLFLEEEVDRVKADLDGIEAELSAFREKHIHELPELFAVNVKSLNNMEMNINGLNEQYRNLHEREAWYKTQLASIDASVVKVNPDERRLEELKVHLAFLISRFSDEYPDVIKTRSEIEYIEERIREKEEEEENAPPKKSTKANHPAYLTASSQLAGVRFEIKSLLRQIEESGRMIEEYKRRIQATPRVEEMMNSIVARRNTTKAKYDDLTAKMMEARVSQVLEKEQKGERFTLIDPARLPEKPYKPNRKVIVLVGLVLGVGCGICFASLLEFFDDSVRSVNGLTRAFGFPVLVSIPVILTPADKLRRRIFRIAAPVLLVVFISAGLAVFHFMVMDLNIFWAKVMRRIALL
ncbi:MAG: chain-length determining protein [Desulfobacterales bacterium]|nr:chain-length determining protein [Desulfobacterales bacterium]